MPTPTIRWNVDADGDWGTAADWDLGRVPGAADDVAVNTADFHTVTHGAGFDTVHTLTVRNDDFVVSGGRLTITSTASFAHRLAVTNARLELDGDTTVANLSQFGSPGGVIAGAGTLTVTETASFSGNILESGPGRTVLTGASAALQNADFGLDGGRVLENQGTLLVASATIAFGYHGADGSLINDAGATIDLRDKSLLGGGNFQINDSFTNAGVLEKTGLAFTSYVAIDFVNTGTVLVQTGALKFDGGGSADAGAFAVASGATLFFTRAAFSFGAAAIGGAGTLLFGFGMQSLNSGATLTVANWSISDSSATFVNETLTYRGAFSESLGSTLTVAAGDTLNLTGRQSLAGTVNGPGVITLSSAGYRRPLSSTGPAG